MIEAPIRDNRAVRFWFEPYSWTIGVRIGWWKHGDTFEVQIGPVGATVSWWKWNREHRFQKAQSND